MNPENSENLICLIVMDGWGLAPAGPGNAVSLANTPNINKFWSSYPHTQLKASGEAVGLPRSEAGNTETGHLNIGAGRIVYQDLERINMSIADESFFTNPVLIGAIEHARQYKSNLHYMGLIGAGGVHSNIEHLYALISLAKRYNFERLYLHLFTDGRDSPPTSSLSYINKIREVINREKVGKIASITGRYWAMDRDRRWDRTQKAYEMLTEGRGHLVKTVEEAIEMSYSQGKTDEFIEPCLITDPSGKPTALIKDNDSVVFFNFRIDRPRQLTAAFIVTDFNDSSLSLDFDPYLERYKQTHLVQKVFSYQKVFERKVFLKNLYFVTMTEYSKSLIDAGAKVAITPGKIDMPLGRVISEAGLKQLRVAESEKERFVTYYFNGLFEPKFAGEERIIVPSPNVTTYDLKPEMSAYEITSQIINSLDQDGYSFILVNYANPDMVGHSGNIGPAVKACEVVDECVGKVANYVMAKNGTVIITADHGNVEEMINLHTNEIDTEHSTNPVPFIVVSKKYLGTSQPLPEGILADIAPTILSILGVQIPVSMTGINLLKSLEQ